MYYTPVIGMPGLNIIDVDVTANPIYKDLIEVDGVGAVAINVPSMLRKYDVPGVNPLNPPTNPEE